ncbi:hypothetical protein [Streptomyces sp. 2314.4]|uniref:hypothetical protein n=1 Tax=Streptomyces sp. 2314.4 TaxID=1881025 RepID=UPI000897B426|nr:hypothetical protein [Streptomyces sp. 2314.4]SEE30014.1 hypothetical protein SAMN05428943_4319 [Streptomyces sp. 2314.4]
MPDATAELPLAFSVPEGFRDIDFQVSAEVNTNRLIDNLQSLAPAPSQQQIAHAVLAQQAMYELLAAAGAVYAGVLLSGPSEDDPDKPLSSVMLSVTARPSELSNEHTVRRLSRTMGALYPEAEVGVMVLDCGSAVVVTQDTKVPRPVNLLENDSEPTTVRQLHIFVPVPGRLAMADFSIATENIDEWEDCLELIGAVCKTIRFTDSVAA